jgi:hypothetical protein
MFIDDEERQGCIDSISHSLTRTHDFRTRKAREYPDDPRNADAAATLKTFASKVATELSDNSWRILKRSYDPNSKHWQDAITQATRDVGFSNTSKSFPFFVQRLIRLLPKWQADVAA